MMIGVVLGVKMVGPNMAGANAVSADMMAGRMVSTAHAQQALRHTVISAGEAPLGREAPGYLV
jgi:hypothetical protein